MSVTNWLAVANEQRANLIVNSLFARLSVIFFLILLSLGLVTLWLSHRSSHSYFLEYTQKLNRPIAMYIAENAQLFQEGAPDPQALERLAPHVMMINPGLEVYLLDSQGKILSNVTGSTNFRSHVDIDAVREFVDEKKPLPIQGDDPKYQERKSVFSAFPLYEQNTIANLSPESGTSPKDSSQSKALLGYVYVVLAGERHETLFKSVQNSHSLGQLFLTLVGALLLALFGGLLLFFMLTRRLRNLTAKVKSQQLEISGTVVAGKEPLVIESIATGKGDEIEVLESAHNALTEQLVEQNQRLQASDTSRRQFIASLSHDLRTPLMTLQNYLETLQVRNATLPNSAKLEFVSLASKQCSRLGHLINQLFELSKLNSPDMKLQRERFSILELIYDCMQDFMLMCGDRNLQLEVLKDDHESGYEVVADIAAIQRVLENLIGNAVKNTNADGAIKIYLFHMQNNEVQVTIQNSGVVLSEEKLNAIFDGNAKKFYARETDGEGRVKTGGLGLLIVKRIMDLHGCPLQIESGASYGVRLTFCLPAGEPGLMRATQDIALSA